MAQDIIFEAGMHQVHAQPCSGVTLAVNDDLAQEKLINCLHMKPLNTRCQRCGKCYFGNSLKVPTSLRKAQE